MRRRLTALLLPVVLTPVVAAAPAPTIEAVSIRPNASTDRYAGSSWQIAGQRIAITNTALRDIIAQAWGYGPALDRADLARFKLAGGPPALLDSKFDVTARTTAPVTMEQGRLLLRQVLEQRFRLRTHAETRQLPIYAITVARPGRLGPNLKPSQHDCVAFMMAGGTARSPDQPTSLSGESVCFPPFTSAVARRVGAGPLTVLASRVQPNLDRLVVDQTGLSGTFEWDVTYAWDAAQTAQAPSVFTAFEEQLGLKLEARTGPVEIVVIDAVQPPSPD
jgi:uncharacterized protein (TIGR03435 family)